MTAYLLMQISDVHLPGNHDDRATFRRHLLGTDEAGPVWVSPAHSSRRAGQMK